MTEDEIITFVEGLGGVVRQTAAEGDGSPEVAWGDTFFFYDPDGSTPPERRFPFATIVVSDYPGFDESSQLDRPGVFRVNAWVGREAVAALAPEGDDPDPAELDRVIPHPVYRAQGWVSVLNPGERSAARARELLRDAHRQAAERWSRKNSSEPT